MNYRQYSIVISECLDSLIDEDPKKRLYFGDLFSKIIAKSCETEEGAHRIFDILSPAFIEQKSGLNNWHIFKSLVEYYIKTPEAGDAVLLSYDLVDFKKLNDSKGQEVGDLFITEFGQALSRVVRTSDETRSSDVSTNIKDPEQQRYPSRIGGDEFAVILTGIKDAMSVDLDDLCHNKVQDLLNDAGLRKLMLRFKINSFGVRVGATVLDHDLTYSQNMAMAHPKNEEQENINMRAKSRLINLDGQYRIIDDL